MALVTESNYREPIHSTKFVQETKELDPKGTGGIRECGYVNDGVQLPLEYLIKITSIRNRYSVLAVMQEPIQIKVESKWDPFIPSSMLHQGNIIAQMVTGSKTSLITKASSRRLWQGSSPMTISLSLKFEAYEDAYKEVALPVKILQMIALPSDPSGGKGWSMQGFTNALIGADVDAMWKALSTGPLLSPPGPTPFSMEGILNLGDANEANRRSSESEFREGIKGGDILIIEWGRFLTFYNVIVKEVTPSIPPMFNRSGDPISASVNIIFETYEMMTVEELEKCYTKGILSKSKNITYERV